MRLLVTDTTWNIAGLAHAMGEEGFYITEAATGAEVLEYVASAEQNAVIIDPDLPDMEAVSLITRLRTEYPRLVICVVSRSVTEADRTRFMIRGADDVIEWPCKRAEIAARLRAYVRRTAGFAQPVLEAGDLSVDIDQRKVRFGDMPIHLTRLEYELIEMLVLRGGAMVSREQVMMQLYAWQDEPDAKIVDVYICRIRAKLAAIGAGTEVIVTSFGQGVRMPVLSRPREVPAAA
ncbi:response regulator transcription factor [Pseudooceanicola spongiae]|uniref:Response regulator n=1 Tax=Pseudooceanicola spongiae TaxID=2613965 RepID=A0A7L9WPT3_9RHOB|nr:response regulator transcription factor [Pseudooceanicola spongiae]QOL81518.1 response regulator [Pseudooceanicola spongiae]